MSQILAIDPGPKESAYVVYGTKGISAYGKIDNYELRRRIYSGELEGYNKGVIEMIASYGMAVGAEVFETCVWIGRFIEVLDAEAITYDLVYRKDVKMHICGSVKAKDANIRQALIDRFGPQGTKKNPGVLYGITKDKLAALAVAVTYYDKHMISE